MTGEKPETRRVAIVVTAAITANTFVRGFATYLAGLGHAVTVLADGLEPSTSHHGAGTITTVPIRMSRSPRPFRDVLSLFALMRAVRDIRPDVLTYATPKASLLGGLAGTFLRVPVRVYLLWGLRLETTAGPARRILMTMERVTSWCSTRILPNSRSLANRYTELNLHSGRPVEVLGRGSSHGIDLRRFSTGTTFDPVESATACFVSTGFIVGFVGRLHPDKGIDTLVRAIHLCQKSGVDARLLVVGWDEGATWVGDTQVESFVHMVGHAADPRPYYAAMHVLALPSRREGFPNVVLEAAAMRVPALVSDATGMVDSVEDGVTGLVVPVDNAEELATAIAYLAEATDVRERLGHSARAHVERHYAQERVWGLYAMRLLTAG